MKESWEGEIKGKNGSGYTHTWARGGERITYDHLNRKMGHLVLCIFKPGRTGGLGGKV